VQSTVADARTAALSTAAAAVAASSLVAEPALAAGGLLDSTPPAVSVPTIDVDSAISVAADLIRVIAPAERPGSCANDERSARYTAEDLQRRSWQEHWQLKEMA